MLADIPQMTLACPQRYAEPVLSAKHIDHPLRQLLAFWFAISDREFSAVGATQISTREFIPDSTMFPD
jgi:hypothetical protein